MGILRLHPKDCEKFGVPEVIEFDLTAIGVRQRKAFEKQTGYTLRWMFNQLDGVPELDEHHNPIPIPVIDEETGEQKVENGEPLFEPKLTTDPDAVAMLVWLILWGVGIREPWDSFDVLENGLIITGSPGDDDPGKDEAPPTDSESSTNT